MDVLDVGTNCVGILAMSQVINSIHSPMDIYHEIMAHAPDARLSFRDGTVCYWEVGATKAGTPRARIGLEWNSSGELVKEYWDWYDLKAAEAVDPLNRGDRVQIVLKPWKDKHIVNGITVVSRADLKRVPFPTSVGEADEIPF